MNHWQAIQTQIASAKTSNREVTLVAVSKKQSLDDMMQLYALGQRHFAESYCDEALPKITAMPNDVIWHFIGPIQSNKTAVIAQYFDVVHSVDREKIIKRLNDQRPAHMKPLQCLIQVNMDKEKQKAGVDLCNLKSLAQQLAHSKCLALKGLMIIPKRDQTQAQLIECFIKTRTVFGTLKAEYSSVDTLSMGMSNDYALAITHGSTLVRIGRALFGQRKGHL